MRQKRLLSMVGGTTIVAAIFVIILTAIVMRDRWMPWLAANSATDHQHDDHDNRDHGDNHPNRDGGRHEFRLSPQAQKNLGLVSKPIVLQPYWRTIQVPGVIIDRPGVTDRGVTAPAVGVVTQVHAFAGDTVRPGEKLVTLRLFSEYLQNTQSELFKATRETELIKEERARIQALANAGSIAGNRIIDLDQRIRRQDALVQAYRQDLLTRGLAPSQIGQITEGNFVATIDVVAPPFLNGVGEQRDIRPVAFVDGGGAEEFGYEVQELKVDLGQQVQAGQLLSVLANHQSLYIEGHAFKQEAPNLERAAQNGWSIRVEFAEDDSRHWPPLDQSFEIRHLANTIDAANRTFDFFVPLTNQSRAYDKQGKTFIVWRFRPGQRVRLHVPVEQLENVIVLPAAAIVREGPETYVFRQKGNRFSRLPVHVILEDRLNVVLANDSAIAPGVELVQGSAASLNRVLRAQSDRGLPAGIHVHADGTTHAAH
ncbi:MAG: MchE protein [Planctomycetota bacterium]|nr:MchE protein [Planctomycetota bacterium]